MLLLIFCEHIMRVIEGIQYTTYAYCVRKHMHSHALLLQQNPVHHDKTNKLKKISLAVYGIMKPVPLIIQHGIIAKEKLVQVYFICAVIDNCKSTRCRRYYTGNEYDGFPRKNVLIIRITRLPRQYFDQVFYIFCSYGTSKPDTYRDNNIIILFVLHALACWVYCHNRVEVAQCFINWPEGEW